MTYGIAGLSLFTDRRHKWNVAKDDVKQKKQKKLESKQVVQGSAIRFEEFRPIVVPGSANRLCSLVCNHQYCGGRFHENGKRLRPPLLRVPLSSSLTLVFLVYCSTCSMRLNPTHTLTHSFTGRMFKALNPTQLTHSVSISQMATTCKDLSWGSPGVELLE